VVEAIVHTTPPKEDKVDTSLVEAPTAQALVARLGSQASDDNLVDDDISFLSFSKVESEIICQMNSQLQKCWPDSGEPEYPVWYFEWSSFCTP
jgi:hypothetical protein